METMILQAWSVKKIEQDFLSLSNLAQLVTPSTMLIYQILEAMPGNAPDLQPPWLLIPTSVSFS